jgi:hypothetical protein
MKHLGIDQLEEYALGRGISETVEVHLLICGECREAVTEVDALRAALAIMQREEIGSCAA